MTSTALNAARRNADLTALADGAPTDVVVIGGGITGAGIALDAASRGLRVTLVEKHDLAFGTSRWSSKLVHGGLRYLATGDVGIARRSAVERGILMMRNAPHLVRAMPQLVPLLPSMGRAERALVRAGFLAGDVLRKTAGTPGSILPGSQRISAQRTIDMAPARLGWREIPLAEPADTLAVPIGIERSEGNIAAFDRGSDRTLRRRRIGRLR